jgi:hypothetical protein
MSVIEEFRQALQDFLAPELRAIVARLDAQDKVADARYKEQQLIAEARQKEIESRFKEVDSRFKEVDSRFNEVSVRLQSLQETVDRNDSAQKLLITKLTQDFQFDKRITELERESRLSKSTSAA